MSTLQDTKLAKTVRHVTIEVSFRHRAAALEDIITFYGKGSHAIVFTQTKRECDELASGGVFKTLTSQVVNFLVWRVRIIGFDFHTVARLLVNSICGIMLYHIQRDGLSYVQ